MAGHEDMANCKIRRMSGSQGGGLGVYATEDIEYAQELLIVNQEYPTGREEVPPAAAPCPDAQTSPSANADTMTAMRDAETPDSSLDEETEGSQYATFDEWGGWKMHEPTNPWQDGSLHQQSTPTPANNIPHWQALTEEYQHITIPVAESTDLRKDLWLTSLNFGSLS